MAITRNAVVGVFENEAAARRAVDNLVNSGFNRNDIHLGSSSDFTMDAASGGAGLTGRAPTEHHGGGFTGWLRSLFGDHDDERSDSDYYAQELQRGRCVVAVDTDDDNRDRAIDVLNDEGAIDVDQNAASGTYTGTGMNTGTGTGRPIAP